MIPNNVLQMLGNFAPSGESLKNIKTPDDMAQFLLNNGRVSQEQVNRAKQMWGNPQIQQMINNKYGQQ